MKDHTTRICLWASPRNISTALMYSFAQRSDTRVFDEPFYGFYLSHTQAHEYHPGSDEIISSLENDGNKVIETILGPHEKSIVFFKNMTHHMLDLDLAFTKKTFNIILTRDPKEMLTSFVKVVPNPKMEDVGYRGQAQLLQYFKENKAPYLVVDSKDILIDPAKALSLICEKAGIEFSKEMLSWNPGKRPEDGVWAKYWYDNVHQSTGFGKYEEKQVDVPKEIDWLLAECEEYYQLLIEG
ncbi:MAG: sulfotransferase family protein [Bacteroidota bacterium]